MLDMNALTLGEIAQIEDIAGQSISVMADDAAPKAKLMAAMAYIARRREDPTYTLQQAEAMSMEEFDALWSDEADPKAS